MKTVADIVSYNAARLVPALRDVTPQYTRLGNVVIDVSYVVRLNGAEVGVHSTLDEAQAHADEVGGVAVRKTIEQTAEEFAQSEFERIHDC